MRDTLFIYGHATLLLGNMRLLVAGGVVEGQEDNTVFLLHIIDLGAGTITRLHADGAEPGARYRMAAVLLGDELAVMGGWSVGEAPDTEDGMWMLNIADLSSSLLTWRHIKPTGDKLKAAGRHGHCAIGIDDRTLLIHGGMTQDGRTPADVHLYDKVTDRWLTLFEGVDASAEAEVPGRTSVRLRMQSYGRSMHDCVLYHGRIVVVGGKDRVNL